jgi:hypothetical protein
MGEVRRFRPFAALVIERTGGSFPGTTDRAGREHVVARAIHGMIALVVKFKQMVPVGSESFCGISIYRRASNVRSIPLGGSGEVRK